MISECEEHGYFRDEHCPVCGEKGKFVMSDREVEKIGRTLAAILRHGKFGLEMSEQGYVGIKDIVDTMRQRNERVKWLRPWQLEALVLTDPKGRYQIMGNKARATYGHTIDVNLKLPTDNNPEFLYYPADPDDAGAILGSGILPGDRKMVHLSKTYEDALRAGIARCDEPAILEIDTGACAAAGHPIGKAARTVYLVDMVPPEAVREAERPEPGGDRGEGEGDSG